MSNNSFKLLVVFTVFATNQTLSSIFFTAAETHFLKPSTLFSQKGDRQKPTLQTTFTKPLVKWEKITLRQFYLSSKSSSRNILCSETSAGNTVMQTRDSLCLGITSQAKVSFSRRRGIHPLVCWIQPWQDSTPVSLQVRSRACRRFSLVFSPVIDLSPACREKQSYIELRKGERTWRQTTKSPVDIEVLTFQDTTVTTNTVFGCSGLYRPKVEWWWKNPTITHGCTKAHAAPHADQGLFLCSRLKQASPPSTFPSGPIQTLPLSETDQKQVCVSGGFRCISNVCVGR